MPEHPATTGFSTRLAEEQQRAVLRDALPDILAESGLDPDAFSSFDEVQEHEREANRKRLSSERNLDPETATWDDIDAYDRRCQALEYGLPEHSTWEEIEAYQEGIDT
jgi:hypothetical protein